MRQSVQELFEKYQNNLYIVACNICKNAEDAKDVVQDTFIQYYSFKKEFESEQHIRAWLILEDFMETLVFETPESLR